jgi:hypothetical protein
MKQAKYIALCLALLMLMTSCHKEESQPEEDTVTPAVEESESPEPAESEEPEDGISLTGLETYPNSRAVNENGDVFLTAKLANDAMLGDQYIYSIYLHDMGEDDLVAEYTLADVPAEMEYYGDEVPGSQRYLAAYNLTTGYPEGEAVYIPEDSYESETWMYTYAESKGSILWVRQVDGNQLNATSYDSGMNERNEFQSPVGSDIYGYFSQDGSKYYVCQNGSIVRYAVDGSAGAEQLTLNMTFSVDSLGGVFVDGDGNEYAQIDGVAGDLFTYRGIVNLNTGELVYLTQSSDINLNAENGVLVAQRYEEGNDTYYICTGDTSYTYNWTGEEYMHEWILSNRDVLFFYYIDEGDGNPDLFLGLYDGDTGTLLSSTTFQVNNGSGWPSAVVVSPNADNELILTMTDYEGNTWFYSWEYGGANHEMDSMTVSESVLPEEMVPEIDDNWDPRILTPGECPAELSEQRQRADEIGAEYGVDIFISKECCNYLGGYVVMEESDATVIDQALDILEEQLAMYPDGFFQQFDGTWIDGIDIYLAGTLMGRSAGVLDYAGGFQLEYNGGYAMVIDVSWPDSLTSTFHHELSHAIESKLGWDSDVYIDGDEWAKLNPDASVYGDSYTDSYEEWGTDEIRSFVYGWCDPEDAYFIDEYSLTYPTEDRARLFEYVMCPDYAWIDFEESPHLAEKLNLYASYIREGFDTTGWDDVRWEKYLNN